MMGRRAYTSVRKPGRITHDIEVVAEDILKDHIARLNDFMAAWQVYCEGCSVGGQHREKWQEALEMLRGLKDWA